MDKTNLCRCPQVQVRTHTVSNENPYSHTFSYADLHIEKYGKKKIYRLLEKGKFNNSIGNIIYMDLPPNIC